MYLVDTSVWIDYFRGHNNAATEYFANLIDRKTPFGITGVIYQEILQGAKTANDLKQLINYLSTQYFFHPTDSIATYQNAAKLYFECRRIGKTPRSSIDCLIAQISIEYRLILLHNDKDYEVIQQVTNKLKLANV